MIDVAFAKISVDFGGFGGNCAPGTQHRRAGQVRVIQENVNDDTAENLVKCTTEVTIACALCFPEAHSFYDGSNHINRAAPP